MESVVSLWQRIPDSGYGVGKGVLLSTLCSVSLIHLAYTSVLRFFTHFSCADLAGFAQFKRGFSHRMRQHSGLLPQSY